MNCTSQYRNQEYYDSPGILDLPRTPQRTPVMGVMASRVNPYHHRRALSNVSYYSNVNRGFQDFDDYEQRFSSLNINPGRDSPHLVPYNRVDNDIATTHIPNIPNRMRLYENVSNFQHLRDSPEQPSSLQELPPRFMDINGHSDEKRRFIVSSEVDEVEQELQNIRSPFLSHHTNHPHPLHLANDQQIKPINSTGCTPQDSDDSSYLSARDGLSLSSRYSQENFLNDEYPLELPQRRPSRRNFVGLETEKS